MACDGSNEPNLVQARKQRAQFDFAEFIATKMPAEGVIVASQKHRAFTFRRRAVRLLSGSTLLIPERG
jgi:hypothetical protein